MSFIKTQGLLVSKIPLANDDGLLEFFTPDLGLIKCFVPRFFRSKKLPTQIDFFQLLQLEFRQSRGQLKWKQGASEQIFMGVRSHRSSLDQAFLVLKRIKKFCPEQKAFPEFFWILTQSWGAITKDNAWLFQTFIRLQLLKALGTLPRLDQVRSDVYINPENWEMNERRLDDTAVYLVNEQRQWLEFLRRADFAEIFLKQKALLEKGDQVVAHQTLQAIENYH